jgi:hypothetical protein
MNELTIDEINIVLEKLKDLIKHLPNDIYIKELHDLYLKDKHFIESKNISVIASNKEKAFYFYAVTRKLSDEKYDFNNLKSNWKELFMKVNDKELYNRKIILKRKSNWYNLNSLEIEANKMLSNLIYNDFLNNLNSLIINRD